MEVAGGWDRATAVPLIRAETFGDAVAREALLDRVMGSIRFRRASQRLREGQAPALALVAEAQGAIVGTLRLWPVKACGLERALMLGPLAVDLSCQGLGVGGALMREAIAAARATEAEAIVLVGDPAYYARFGFSARAARRLSMPGPFERHRMMGLALSPCALDRAHGVLKPLKPMSGEAPVAQAA